jgi:Ca2+-binding EF-hand superfamily protein
MTDIPVAEALESFQAKMTDAGMTDKNFATAYSEILVAYGKKKPTGKMTKTVFSLFDKDGNGTIDPMELVVGVALLCGGSEEEKMRAIFNAFDENDDGYISPEEMHTFLLSIYKMVMTESVASSIASKSGQTQTAESMAKETTDLCFKQCDANNDGVLSFEEFLDWWNMDDAEAAEYAEGLAALDDEESD